VAALEPDRVTSHAGGDAWLSTYSPAE
jgi:hypothetical protein